MSAGRQPWDQRAALRAPRLTRLANRAMLRLPPGSALRRRMLKRWLRWGYDGLGSGDHALIDLLIEDDYVLVVRGREWESVGLAGEYRGRQGWRDFLAIWDVALGKTWYRPLAVLDLGARIAVKLEVTARGVSSDVPARVVSGWVYTLERGRIIRHETYYEWEQCVQALGLPPAAG